MAENKHQLLVTIGAALSRGFNFVISGSSSKIKSIGSVIKDLEKQSVLSAASVDKLKSRYNSLLGSMNKQQAIIAKRGFYRSQIMEVAALGAALAVPIRNAIKFEDSLSNIAAVVNFPEPDGLKKLGDTITQLSLKIPKTADELASIAAIGGRFQVSLSELPKFTEELAKTAVAWRMNSDEAAEKIGNLMKVFKIKATELAPVYDVINHLGNLTGATADNILKAINRSADGISNFKLQIPQVAALTSTIMSFGEGAEQAGSAISVMLQKLSMAPSLGSGAQKVLHQLGFGVNGLAELIQKDPQKVLDKFFDAVSKMDAKTRASGLNAIFGRGAAKTVGKLVDNLELYRHNLELVNNPTKYKGSRAVDYGIVFDTARSKLTLLTNNLGAFSREVGASLIPALNQIVDGINSVLSPVMQWMQQNKELTQTITTGIAGLVGFRIATFTLGYASTFLFGVLNRLIIVFKGLRLGLSLFGVAFRASLGLIGAFATAGWLIYENWESVQGFLGRIWEPIKPYWGSFKNKMDELGVTEAITNAWAEVQNFFSNIWRVVAPHWEAFYAKIKELGLVDGIIKAWNRVKEFFTKIWAGISPIIDKITSPLKILWSGAKQGLQKVGNLFSSDSKAVGSKIELTKNLKPANLNVTRNQSNNFEITINAAKNDNAEAIANRVVNRVSEYKKTFLFDEVGATI